MQFVLNIENDEELRQHIKSAIDGQVRSIVRSEVAETVKIESARLLPTVTKGWSYEQKVNAIIEKAVNNILYAYAKEVGFTSAFIESLINKKLEEALKGKDWNLIIDSLAKEKLKTLIG